MTSTPTACPDCNNCGLPCLNEIHHPRQPDTSARDAAADAYATTKRKWSQDGERFTHEEHAQGIGLSICPSTAKAFRKGADWGHARALKEMDAEVARLQGEIVKRNQYKLNEQALANVHEHYEKRLAAAQSEIKRLTGNCEVKDKNKKRLERMYGKLEQQLAAAQNVIDELELNESKMNGALSAKQEQLAAAELKAGEYEREIAHALRYLRESGAGDERLRGEPEFEMLESFEQALAAHRRGGECG